jgi:Zn-dependent protease with chaperone function
MVLGLLSLGALAAVPWLQRWAPPTVLVSIGLSTLVAMVAAMLAILAALVDLGEVPMGGVGAIVSRCLGVVRDVAAHPLDHWPRIAAAMLLVAVLIRLVVALTSTLVEMRAVSSALLKRAAGVRGRVHVVASSQPFAMTVGVIGPRIVVSTGLLSELSPAERSAVIAHERAHIAGAHPLVLVAVRTIDRALGWIPPVRAATGSILVGLEVAADGAAVAAVGDPMIVARALERVAAAPFAPATRLAIGDTEILTRVRRLCLPGASRNVRHRRVATVGVTTVAAIVAIISLTSVPASAHHLVGSAGDTRHAICHLPH